MRKRKSNPKKEEKKKGLDKMTSKIKWNGA